MHKLYTRLLSETPLLSDAAITALLTPALTAQLGDLAAEHPALSRLREQVKPKMSVTDDGIGIIPVEGVLARKPDVWEMLFYGVEDTNSVMEMVESAFRNGDVRGAFLDIDSPGGFVTGGPEVADAVKELGRKKPVVAWTGGTMASLAYWIGVSAEAVVATRASIVGSVGAYTTHVDYTKALEAFGAKVEIFKNKEADFKAAGALGTALTDAQRENIRERVQSIAGQFLKAVKAARPNAAEETMRGQVFYGFEARAAGLVDAIGNRDSALRLLRSKIRSS